MFLCLKIYRLSSALNALGIPFLPSCLDYLNRILFSCWIPGSIRAGENLVLGYGGLGIVIHGACKLGDNVHIDQNVTLGGNATELGVPTVGDNVYIGAGSVVIGPITIGNDVVVGANSVVSHDVEAGTVVVGAPARVIHQGILTREFLFHQRGT